MDIGYTDEGKSLKPAFPCGSFDKVTVKPVDWDLEDATRKEVDEKLPYIEGDLHRIFERIDLFREVYNRLKKSKK